MILETPLSTWGRLANTFLISNGIVATCYRAALAERLRGRPRRDQSWRRPSRVRDQKAAPGVPGAEGAVRGRDSEAGSRPALRAAAAVSPNPEARSRARLAPSFDHI